MKKVSIFRITPLDCQMIACHFLLSNFACVSFFIENTFHQLSDVPNLLDEMLQHKYGNDDTKGSG